MAKALYPPIEPYDHGLLDVGDGNRRYRGARRFFPEEWMRFRAAVPEAERDGDLVAAYARLLEDPDPEVRARATDSWCAATTGAWVTAALDACGRRR